MVANQARHVVEALGRERMHSWLPVDAPPPEAGDTLLATLR